MTIISVTIRIYDNYDMLQALFVKHLEQNIDGVPAERARASFALKREENEKGKRKDKENKTIT